MKKVVLEAKHKALGAKMMEFAGFNMPLRYSSDKREHLAVRENVGVFDVSHMGEFFVEGENAEALIQYISSNDVSMLEVGEIQYSCFPNESGGIIDDLLVYRLSDKKYMLVVNAGNIDKDWDWVCQYNKRFNAQISNLSDDYSLLAVQGPKSVELMSNLVGQDLSFLKYYTFTSCNIAGYEDVLISATGYTGSGGFEIYLANNQVEKVWALLFEKGKDYGIEPIGLGARDTLRLEMGYCLYGNDINEVTSPIEAGLSWICKFNHKFMNSDALLKQKEEGIFKKLVGLKMIDKGVPRHDYKIFIDEEEIGLVTSGTISPSLGYGVAMAYVAKAYTKIGTVVEIEVRNKRLKAEVVKFPFYKQNA